MKALTKFIITFIISIGLLLVVVPMFTGLQLNTMIALFFAGVSAMIGFFVILNHHNIIRMKHAPFVIGLILVLSMGSLLYGSISTSIKPELYWQIPSQLITFSVILLIVGLAIMVLTTRRMFQ